MRAKHLILSRAAALSLVVASWSLTAMADGVAAPTTNTSFVPAGGTANTAFVPSGTSNAAASANSAGNSQSGAQMAAIMTAAMMASQCGPHNPAACMLAALAAIQAGSLGDTSGGAYNAQGLSSTAPGATSTAPVVPGSAAPGAGASISGIKQTLASKGAVISPDGTTMTLPNGTSVPLNANSATDSGMKAAGLSDQQIALGKQALADAGAVASSKSGEMAVDGGGGGAVSGSGPSAATEPKKPAPIARKSLSGLSKNFGGSKIGVSADDIFDMVSRRYKAKDADNTFIKN